MSSYKTELQNRVAKQSCKTELQNRVAKPSCKTELQNRVAKPSCKTELRVVTSYFELVTRKYLKFLFFPSYQLGFFISTKIFRVKKFDVTTRNSVL